MNAETAQQTNKRGVLATAISLSLLLTACGGGGGSAPLPPPPSLAGIVATPATITLAEDTSATFDVVLNTEPTADVVIFVSSADGSEAGTDVTELTFTDSVGSAPWDVAQTVTVSGLIDDTVDGNQTINVVLDVADMAINDADYLALSSINVAATVSDIDTAGFTIVGSNLNTSEAGIADSFTVVLNTMPDGLVAINAASTDTSEGDVNTSSLFFDSTSWNIPQAITVVPVDELIADGNQTYNITLAVDSGSTDTTGYTALSMPPVVVTNADNDSAGFTVSGATLSTVENGAAASYTVALNTMPDGDVVVDLTSADVSEGTVSPAALSFNAGNWNTAQTVTVAPADDLIADGNQTYSITQVVNSGSTTDNTGYVGLSIPSLAVTNADDDTAGYTVSTATLSTAENGSTTSYTVVLNTIPNGVVVYDIASSDVSEGTVSPATLTFDATNWSTAQTVTVTPVDDDIVDGNQSYGINMTIGGATTDTTGYAAQPLSQIAVTNADDDIAGFTVSTASLSTAENGSAVTYTIVLNTMPDGKVVIGAGTTDLSEGSLALTVLTFNQVNWNTPQTITVIPADDDMADGNQIYDVDMGVMGVGTSTDTTGYIGLSIPSVAVTNADDDTAGFTVSIAGATTTENGAPLPYTVVLNTQPDGDVVLDVVSNDITEGLVSPASLTFTSVDWATPQTVTLAPVDDLEVDGTVTYTIATSVNVSTADSTGYLSLLSQAFGVSNNDDDVVGNVAEGTLLSPMGLLFGTDLPHSGQVDTTVSYYEIIGLTAGASYDVSITGLLDDADLVVYDDSGHSVSLCSSASVGADDFCTAAPTGSSFWIKVTGTWTTAGTTFTLDAQEVTPTVLSLALGTADLPHAGTVDGGISYYEVTGLTSGASYTASVTGMSADVDLYVYLTDSSYTSSDCSPIEFGFTDEICAVTAAGTSMWIAIDGQWTGGFGATFTLDVQ